MAGVQSALYCRCGNEKILRPSASVPPATRSSKQDEEYFGGLREAIL
jgi:hypothetical protein